MTEVMFRSKQIQAGNGYFYNGWECTKCLVTGFNSNKHEHRYGPCWIDRPTAEDKRMCPTCYKPKIKKKFGDIVMEHRCSL